MSTQDAGLSAPETQELLKTLAALHQGDFSVRITPISNGQSGVAGEVAAAVNALIDQLQMLALGVSRLAQTTGVEGNLGTQITVEGAAGTWKDLTDNLNHMSLILAAQVRDIRRVAGAVAEGDLSQKVAVAAGGEMGELKVTFNAMIDQLQLLKSSVNALVQQVNDLGLKPERDARHNEGD